MEFKTGLFIDGQCRIIITKDPTETGLKWHLSISCENRLPTYNELKNARYKYLHDNLQIAQIFPPKAEFVNMHPFCLHLWEL